MTATATLDPTATAAPASAAATRRADWVDSAKGLGILLVVMGHAIIGLRDAERLVPDYGLNTLNYLVYTFHMPLFFLLGGLFVPRRVQADATSFVTGLLRRLVYPYFLWSVIQRFVIAAAGSAVNSPYAVTWDRLVALLWEPTSQYWYLHALFFMNLIAAVLYRPLGVTALFLAALIGLGLNALIAPPEVVANVCRFLPFYAAGVALGARIGRGESHRIALPTTVLAMVGWVALASMALHGGFGYWDVAALPAAALGAIAWTGLAQLPALAHSATLRYLGRNSMPIFLMHVLFTAGARIVVGGLLPSLPGWALFIVCLGAGVVGPVLLYEAARRLKLASALGFE